MLVEHLRPESALHRKLAGENHVWTLDNHLRAAMVDALLTANWQRGAKKYTPRPKRIPRPGVVDDTVEKMGTARLTSEELDELFARVAERGE